MAVDKNKIIAEATKLVQRGAFDKAIKTYERIIAEDPKDVRIVLKIGELYQKLRDDKAAAEAFKKVADIYTDQGFFLKAVAVYKQASKLDPDDLRVNEKLAQLNQQLGLMSDAMSQLQLVAAAYEKAGDQARLLDVLKRMVDLDPDNIASSIKLGELHGRANQPDEALEYFQRAADYLKSHSRPDEWVKVAERIAALRPTDAQLARELAHVYLAKGDTKRALAKLQFCFKADPKDVQTLTLLAQAFRDLGQTGKTISVYKELAHVYEEQRKPSEARSIWRKVQELVPDDPDANAAIGGGPAAPAPAPAAVAPARPAHAAPPTGPPPGALRPSAAPAAGPPPGALRQPAAQPAAAPGPGDVVKLLSEVEVYVKYGLHPKALEHLKKIFAIDPENPDALERAREVHFAAGDPEAAVAAGARLVRALHARGDDTRARDELVRVHQIAPGHPEIHELAGLVGGEHTDEVSLDSADVEELTLATDAAVEIAGEDDLALALAGSRQDEIVEDDDETVEDEEAQPDLAAEAAATASDEEEIVDDELPAPIPQRAPPKPPSARPALTPPPARPSLTPPPASARPALTPLPGTLRAPAAAARPAAAPPPGPPPGALKPAFAPAAARPAVTSPPPAAPAPARPAVAPPAARPAAPKAAPAPRPVARPPPPPPSPEELDLSDDLEEADFLIQQGLHDDAKEKLAGLAQFYPDHAGVKAKLAELGRREKGSGGHGEVRATPTLIAPASSDESFDIARDLADELGGAGDVDVGDAGPEDFQFSVEDVFNQFKKGVEQTVGKEDSATHFDLGIAYREMGLLDAAIEEFETAAAGNNRKKEVDCFSMVGLCRVAQGDTKRAIQAFRRALSSEFLTRDAAKALHFEIGIAYESAGNPDGALFFFQKLAKIDPAYRDVAGKVTSLGGGPGRAPPEFAAAAARAAAAPPRAPGLPGSAPRTAPKAPPPAKPSGPATTPVPGSKKNIGYL